MKEELLKGLTKEQIAKAKACQNNEELLALAKQEGIELTKEQLEAVNGGYSGCLSTPSMPCPRCNSTNIYRYDGANRWFNECLDCGRKWKC